MPNKTRIGPTARPLLLKAGYLPFDELLFLATPTPVANDPPKPFPR
tara:strand:- start:169 stop:306 length:138 start_codon:yes stop_codon:yes gene_type:complete